MPIDASIPLQIQQPDSMKTLSSVLGLASTAQNMQAQKLAMQGQEQRNTSDLITLQERQNLAGLMKDITPFQNPDGTLDMNKLMPAVMKAAPTTGPQALQGIYQAQTQATQARDAVNALDENERAYVGKVVTSMVGQPKAQREKTLDALENLNPTLGKSAIPYFRKIIGMAEQQGGQQAVDDMLWRSGRSIQSPAEQQSMQTPSGVGIDNGQQVYSVNTRPGSNVPQGAVIPGTAAQKELPPGTPVMGPGNTPGYLGAQPAPLRNNNPGALMPDGKLASYKTPEEGISALDKNLQSYGKQGAHTISDVISKWAPPNENDTASYIKDVAGRLGIPPDQKIDLSSPVVRHALSAAIMLHENGPSALMGSRGNGFVASGLPVGQAENIGNNIQEMNRHFAGLNDQSTGAPLIAALQGNIKSLIPGAITGTESGRKAYVVGLLNAMGVGGQATGDIQKDTDLLQKQMAQLQLGTPATTDAMRTLVSAARPHSGMSAQAISEAVDQVSGQVKANMAMRNYLQQYKLNGDVQGYTQARQQLEQVADPRAFQYRDMSAQEREAFKKKLTPADRQDLGKKMQALEKMGVL
ncbi:hypothetical protein HZT44_19315 [Ralstonia pickettii]|uniref:hypothetical protein n=1 Tax=Ralstonia pickettii TaxID=329 RepID=UPI0015C8719D|nr:hypothetical protein [Ralstonia pickettii]NYS10341.1 hypothetical protein [Ralstonia pickettii]